ncbi:hypothetical protein CEXT_21191 [Caerostris extrusa]|uniref:Uncharacterized protein n=1 Tax=Caerostris extrusa TaxID=172846 RepID=A0AAV4WW22_CAEEX|nr:hypothetical protein CEXT_21191 [Caerostris extrusa]
MLAANKLPISRRKTTHLSAAKCRKLLLGRRKKRKKKKGSKLYSMKNETYLSEDLNIPAPAAINNSCRELCFLFASPGNVFPSSLGEIFGASAVGAAFTSPRQEGDLQMETKGRGQLLAEIRGFGEEECFRDISLLTGREDLQNSSKLWARNVTALLKLFLHFSGGPGAEFANTPNLPARKKHPGTKNRARFTIPKIGNSVAENKRELLPSSHA